MSSVELEKEERGKSRSKRKMFLSNVECRMSNVKAQSSNVKAQITLNPLALRSVKSRTKSRCTRLRETSGMSNVELEKEERGKSKSERKISDVG